MTKYRHRCSLAALCIVLALSACGSSGSSEGSGVASLASAAAPTPTAAAPTPLPTAESEAVAAPDATAEPTVASPAAAPAAEATATPTVAVPLEELDDETKMLGFLGCMRERGFDAGDPIVSADGTVSLPPPPADVDFDDPELDAAVAECEWHLDGVNLGFDDVDPTEAQDQLLEFSSCMRDNGYDLPDIDINQPPPDVDQDSPEWQAAFATCVDILASIGGGPDSDGNSP